MLQTQDWNTLEEESDFGGGEWIVRVLLALDDEARLGEAQKELSGLLRAQNIGSVLMLSSNEEEAAKYFVALLRMDTPLNFRSFAEGSSGSASRELQTRLGCSTIETEVYLIKEEARPPSRPGYIA